MHKASDGNSSGEPVIRQFNQEMASQARPNLQDGGMHHIPQRTVPPSNVPPLGMPPHPTNVQPLGMVPAPGAAAPVRVGAPQGQQLAVANPATSASTPNPQPRRIQVRFELLCNAFEPSVS